MANKMTQVKAIQHVLENCEIPQEVKDSLTKLKTTLEKKNSSKGGLTKTQEENLKLAEQTLEMLKQENKKMPIKEIRERMGFTSPQKTTSIMKILENQNAVIIETVKGDRYFSVA